MAVEWQETTWGDLATLEYGKALRDYQDTPSTARVFGTNGPIGWHDKALWHGPGVIVGRKGAYRGVQYTEDPYWVIDTAYSLQPKTSINLRWAYYQLKSIDLNNVDDGSPIPSTTRPAFYALPVLKPPRATQDRIADLLSSLDDKIELNRRMAETLEAMARALFRSWFVDFDPVQAKAEGRPTGLPDDLAVLFPDRFGDDGSPSGWATRNLIDDFRVVMGQSPPGSTYNEDGTGGPFYQGKTDFGFRFPTRRVFCTAPTRIAHRGDTLLSVRAPVGDINMADEECCLGRGVAALRHNSGSSSFTYYAAQVLQPAISSFNDDGTVFGAINRKQLEKISFINPGLL